MKIAVVGTGYVGLVTGACLADFGHHVICVDKDADRIGLLEAGRVPFYEPGLREVIERNFACGRLRFTTTLSEAVADAPVVFLAVGTPEGGNGDADLSQLEAVTACLPACLVSYHVIVTKSTVPVGTGLWLRETLRRRLSPGVECDIVANPEFLREGSAINDFLRPDRVVIGTDSERAAAIMQDIYRPLYLIETPIVVTDIETAEMIKYASNAFLAIRIGFMNEIAHLCDRVGADVHVVAKGMGLDKRIGSKFLHPGPGYGGSCFPKDTRALAALGVRHGAPQRLVERAIEVNDRQRRLLVEKIARVLDGLAGRRIAVFGLAFKPNTSDIREAPAIYVCRELALAGAFIRAFDPIAQREARHALADVSAHLSYPPDIYEAAAGADAVVIMTEWNEFRGMDLSRLRDLMARPILVDSRNVLDPRQAVALGFSYFCTGREALAAVNIAV